MYEFNGEGFFFRTKDLEGANSFTGQKIVSIKTPSPLRVKDHRNEKKVVWSGEVSLGRIKGVQRETL